MPGKQPNGNPEIVLNFITPHQKWGIHSTYTDNLMMLTLSRGGPIVWISEDDAKRAGIVDNDWIELFNVNGAIAARAVVSQRVTNGMCLMYHAQEKIVNTPGSEITGARGGIHNSVTRIVIKPTHMIGGYAQLSYGFNYYGTIGTNRDEFVVVRKMKKVDWLDTPAHAGETHERRGTPSSLASASHPVRRMPVRERKQRGVGHEDPRPDRHGAQSRQVHRLPHLLGDLQERLDHPRRHGVRVVQQRRDQARHRLSRRSGRTRTSGTAAGCARATAGSSRSRAASWSILMKIFANPNLPQIDDYYEPFTFDYEHLQTRARDEGDAGRAAAQSLITGERMEKIEWGPNWEEILGGEFAKRSKDANFEAMQKEIYGQFENTFMMYLPRLCEHCLNPTCVASCPSGSIYKREEDGIVLIDQDKCRGWRMCVSGCPYKKIYYNWSSGKAEKCIFCYPRIEAGQPTVCSETCVGRIRYLGVLLYDADRIEAAAAVEDPKALYEAQLVDLPRPERPGGDRAGAPRRRARGLARGRAANRRSTRWRWTGRWRCRCTRSTGRCRWSGTCRRCRRSRRPRTPARSARSASCPTCARCASRSSTSPTC